VFFVSAGYDRIKTYKDTKKISIVQIFAALFFKNEHFFAILTRNGVMVRKIAGENIGKFCCPLCLKIEIMSVEKSLARFLLIINMKNSANHG